MGKKYTINIDLNGKISGLPQQDKPYEHKIESGNFKDFFKIFGESGLQDSMFFENGGGYSSLLYDYQNSLETSFNNILSQIRNEGYHNAHDRADNLDNRLNEQFRIANDVQNEIANELKSYLEKKLYSIHSTLVKLESPIPTMENLDPKSAAATILTQYNEFKNLAPSIVISPVSYNEGNYKEISQKEFLLAQISAFNEFARNNFKILVDKMPVMAKVSEIHTLLKSHGEEIMKLGSLETSHELLNIETTPDFQEVFQGKIVEKGIFDIKGTKFELDFVSNVKKAKEDFYIFNFKQSPILTYSVDGKVEKAIIPHLELPFAYNKEFSEALVQQCTHTKKECSVVGEVLVHPINESNLYCCEIN